MELKEQNNSEEVIEYNSETEPVNEPDIESEEIFIKNKDLYHELKSIFRLLRKKYSKYIRDKLKKEFINILILTTDCPFQTYDTKRIDSPLEFASALRKQYPYINTQILIPIIGLNKNCENNKKLKIELNGRFVELEKKSCRVEFKQGKDSHFAYLYKFPRNNLNVQVYGIYSPAFSYLNSIEKFNKLQNQTAFLRAARTIIKQIKQEGFEPDIIHADKIPFFLGYEFEKNNSIKAKVFQTVNDFASYDMNKQEPFITILSLVNDNEIKRICKDKVIKKSIIELFKLNPIKYSDKLEDCLYIIGKNYENIKNTTDIENQKHNKKILGYLNKRIEQIYPNLFDNGYFYPIINSLNKCDFYGIESKSYYKEVFEKFDVPEPIKKVLIKTAEKACYISTGIEKNNLSLNSEKNVFYPYNLSDFRTERIKNKRALIKEFSFDRIRTNFIDTSLFKREDFNIYGSLDSFYEAPLIFANPEPNIFECGIDILFGTLTKLLERNKNFQLILCIKDGLKQEPIKATLDFILEQNVAHGRIVFIDGEINPEKFLSGADFNIIPARLNNGNLNHLLGMKFGCIPIASKVGILDDTVIDIFDDIYAGNGFKTSENLLREDSMSKLFYDVLIKALDFYRDNPSAWNRIIKNAMNYDSSWSFQKLEKFNKIYQEMI